MLEKDPWLNSLSNDAKSAVLSAIRVAEFKKGKVIFSEGEEAAAFFAIIAGKISINNVSVEGEQSTLTHLSAPYWFGEMSFLDNLPRTHNAVAVSDVTLGMIPKSEMISLMDNHLDFYKALVGQLCRHTRQVFTAIDDILLMSPERLLAKRILDQLATDTDDQEVRLSQDSLARLTGISRQSVNRILKVWEGRGVLQRGYGKLHIPNVGVLRRIFKGVW